MKLNRESLAKLRSIWAVPGYLLALWSLLGQWSRSEFVFRKLDAVSQSGYGRLALLLAGIGWLTYLVTREPPPQPAPTPAELRLARLKELLIEAKREFEAEPTLESMKGDIDQVGKYAFREMKFGQFLNQAFLHFISDDYLKYQRDEKEKWDRAAVEYEPKVANALYVERLLRDISVNDLDLGFQLPDSYEHYRKTDIWVANKRPIPS